MSKWDSAIPKIRDMAGVSSTEEIAKEIGTSVNNLYKICFRNHIRLPRDPETYRGGGRKRNIQKAINDAIDLLSKEGYLVTKRDPILWKARNQGE